MYYEEHFLPKKRHPVVQYAAEQVRLRELESGILPIAVADRLNSLDKAKPRQ